MLGQRGTQITALQDYHLVSGEAAAAEEEEAAAEVGFLSLFLQRPEGLALFSMPVDVLCRCGTLKDSPCSLIMWRSKVLDFISVPAAPWTYLHFCCCGALKNSLSFLFLGSSEGLALRSLWYTEGFARSSISVVP